MPRPKGPTLVTWIGRTDLNAITRPEEVGTARPPEVHGHHPPQRGHDSPRRARPPHGTQGLEGLFPEQDIDTLVHIIQGINTNASFPPANDPGTSADIQRQT